MFVGDDELVIVRPIDVYAAMNAERSCGLNENKMDNGLQQERTTIIPSTSNSQRCSGVILYPLSSRVRTRNCALLAYHILE